MTVAELIKELEKVKNKELEVVTEGCDCNGDVGSVSVKRTSVFLERS